MFAFESVMAVVLLATPPDRLDLSAAAKLHPVLAPAVQTLALQWEVLDPRETKFMLVEADDFAADLKELQTRYQDLRAAPAAAESQRFPSREMAGDLLAFNRAYHEGLGHRLALDAIHADELRAAMREADELYRVWDKVRDARCDYYFVVYRRKALRELRDLVGPQAFYSGQLPPHVPLWRIPIAD